ncbi:MAG: hypothetical protein IT496_11210 [Gammaproteobacteria bacterium]|nr:hypothetical protein [Gammaproteobacteria bacterium]
MVIHGLHVDAVALRVRPTNFPEAMLAWDGVTAPHDRAPWTSLRGRWHHEWVHDLDCGDGVMESTGVYWIALHEPVQALV